MNTTWGTGSIENDELRRSEVFRDLMKVIHGMDTSKHIHASDLRLFENKGGAGLIRFEIDEFMEALFVKDPILATFSDCDDSSGELFALNGNANREELRSEFVTSLLDGRVDGIYEKLPSLLEVMSPGIYLASTFKVDLANTRVLQEYRICEKEHKYYSGAFCESMQVIFTRDKRTMNQERIRYFEELIKFGGRPKCLLFDWIPLSVLADGSQDRYQVSVDSFQVSYLLDGHHKFCAYMNLKMAPECMRISEIVYPRLGSTHSLLPACSPFFLKSMIEHVIRFSPERRTDPSPNSVQYNEIFDHVLRTSEDLPFLVVRALYKAHQESAFDWLKRKLDVLRNRLDANAPFDAFDSTQSLHKRRIETIGQFETWWQEQLSIDLPLEKLSWYRTESKVPHGYGF